MNKKEKNNRNKKTAAEVAGKITKDVFFLALGIGVSVLAPKLGEKLLEKRNNA